MLVSIAEDHLFWGKFVLQGAFILYHNTEINQFLHIKIYAFFLGTL